PLRQSAAVQYLTEARSNRIHERLGRNIGVEHADLFSEVQAARGDGDAVAVAARDEILGAPVGERGQDLEIRLRAQLVLRGGLDAEVGDGVALHVRLVVLGLAYRDDAVEHRR